MGGRSTLVQFPGIGYTQAIVLEDSPTLKFSDSLINFRELDASVEEDLKGGLFDTTTEIPLEIPDVAPLAALQVCLSETLALLRISSGSEIGVTAGP